MTKVPVLVDTNAILEAHRVGAWKALRGGHRLETVEACVMETQTGAQNRRPERRIDEAALRADLAAVHTVTNFERAAASLRDSFVGHLDDGERDLWSHALPRPDVWLLCGPDKASLRLGIRLGYRDRLVSLEELLGKVGHRPRQPLERAYTTKWHNEQVAAFLLEEEGRHR
jgi:hypothetical protein